MNPLKKIIHRKGEYILYAQTRRHSITYDILICTCAILSSVNNLLVQLRLMGYQKIDFSNVMVYHNIQYVDIYNCTEKYSERGDLSRRHMIRNFLYNNKLQVI